jgi:hypothetical protein
LLKPVFYLINHSTSELHVHECFNWFSCNISFNFLFRLAQSLLNLFPNYQQRFLLTSFSNQGFNQLYGFDFFVDSNVTYHYAINYNVPGSILKYSSDWEYLGIAPTTITWPVFIKTIDNDIYVAADNNVFKTDKNLTVVNSINFHANHFRGIYHDQSTDSIYVAAYNSELIFIFNRDLALLQTLSTSGNRPLALAGYQNKIYVGTMNHTILVLQNNIIASSLNTVCEIISSLLIDDYGTMLVLCRSPIMLYFYNVNGTMIGSSPVSGDVTYMNFDSKGRFIINSFYQFNIYY